MSGERENERDESDSSRYTNDFKSVVGEIGRLANSPRG